MFFIGDVFEVEYVGINFIDLIVLSVMDMCGFIYIDYLCFLLDIEFEWLFFVVFCVIYN